MKRLLTSLPLMAILSSGCTDPNDQPPPPGPGNPPPTEPTTQVPAALAVEWEPTDNSVGSWKFFRSTFTLENKGPGELGNQGWKLYFNFVRRILNEGEGDETGVQALAKQGVKISKPASGDYYVIEPLPDFKPIAPGERRAIDVLASDWAILKTDAPAGFHIVFTGEKFSDKTAFAVPLTVKLDAANPKQTTRFEGDAMPVQTPGLRYDENPAQQQLDLKARLLPAPRTVEAAAGQVSLKGELAIGFGEGLKNEASYLAAALKDVLAANITSRATGGGEQIRLEIKPDLGTAEGYELDVKDGSVTIRGTDAAGVFYGVQTLRQLIPTEVYAAAKTGARPQEIILPGVHIADAPGFVYRGMALDVGRHFQTKETVKRLLDVLAHYKINKFHFHLTDDEGWRLEIPGLPELTSYGSRRGFDPAEEEMLHAGFGSSNDLAEGDRISLKPPAPSSADPVKDAPQGYVPETVNFMGKGSGYYTVKDFEEILVYAKERHIDVIPEVDVPGHSRAAVKSMEYRFRKLKDSDPAQASAYRLVDPADTSKHESVQMYTDNFINPCLDTSYAFLTKVVQEIKARYDAVGAPLYAIHGGGDELPSLNNGHVWWQGSPLCKQNAETRDLTDIQLFNLFFKKWKGIITATGGTQMTGWDDIIHNGQDLPGFIPMPWSNVWGWGREDDAYKFANQGYKVILSHSTNLYLDLAYNKDPDEPGYYWANFVDTKKTFEYRPFDIYANATQDRMGNPIDASTWKDKVRLNAEGKKNILGMHGLLWAENQKSPALLDYFAFPKMLGVAERSWNPELPAVSEMPALWARFTNSLGQFVLPRLDGYRAVDVRGELPSRVGVNYRIPLPGAKIVDGKLNANVLFPGLEIDYSTDAGASWKPYTEPVAVSGAVSLRARASDGRTSRVAVLK
ncbi:MAG TPA: family 20 glycosylhydrolase [Cystobacter sp.]